MTMPWINLPLTATLLGTIGILAAVAVILVLLSFGSWTGSFVQRFRGVVPPFFGSVTLILAILIGFLANDIWDRDQRAVTSVRNEADGLVTLFTLVSTSGTPVADPVANAIRTYATAVTKKEWPAMARGESAPEAEKALDDLLRIITHPVSAPESNPVLDRALLDTVLGIRANRNTRLALSEDETAPLKWVAVLTLAVMSQISLAVVHLEKTRPQIAAMTIYTVSLIFLLGLLATHEVPFVPPTVISSDPIAHVLDLVPRPAVQVGGHTR
jgi:Protein of unknown function (DUF4239)